MSSTNASNISIVLSGGTVNLNPDDSIGGDPSSSPILDATLNNLFADVTADQTATGYEDYRCIYMFNDGPTPVYNFGLWIESDFSGGATMELGITNSNESQRVTISGGPITGGSFTLSYKTFPFVVNYNSDLSVWVSSFQSALDNLQDGSGNIVFDSPKVIAQNAGANTFVFDVSFSGLDAKRNLDKLQVASNSLISTSTISIFISTTSEGAPINTIAPEINLETTPPGGVGFYAASKQSPITLPVLNPNDGFPLWIKRTIVAGTEAVERDGFQLSFRADSIKS